MTARGRTRRGGIAYLVGAGPGDPGLLTVRGRELLDECDAIVYDALANPALLERASDAPAPELHDVGKRGGDSGSTSQEDINALLVRLVRQGKRVVRPNGGGPFVFGRKLSYVDLSMFQIVEGLRYAFPKRMKRFEKEIPRLVALRDRVAPRPRIAAYLESDRRIAFNEWGIFRADKELDG